MSIRKGDEWGVVVALPSDATVIGSDAALARIVSGAAPPSIGLAGGDLARTVGGGAPGRMTSGGSVARVTVDVVDVVAEGRSAVFVAHLVARRRSWRGEVVMVMNAEFFGVYDVAPRGHPADGRVEVIRVSARMPWRARLAARQRARTGNHLPHPDLDVASVRQIELEFARPLRIHLDGVYWTTTRSVRLRVRPDAVVVHV